MRVAVLGCIHGNLPALEAVLADADAASVDRVVCAGDVVGWGPQPRECLALLRNRGIPSIRGHDDRRVVDLALDEAESVNGTRPARNVRWTLDRLDGEDVRALGAFPLSYGFAASGRTIVVVHGTPRDEDAVLLPDTPPRKLAALLLISGAEILACAHGHRAFVREVEGGGLVVNVGSVGRPFDGDVRAAYAIVDVGPQGAPRGEIRRVEHDVAATLAAARAEGAPRRTLEELAARARGAAFGPEARGLVLTAPYRGAPTLANLARETIRHEAKRLAKAGRDESDPAEATHDARVATRRLESALSVFEMLLPDSSRIQKELRAIQKGLSAARDLDVARKLLEACETKDATASVALDAALETLEQEREGAEKARARALARAGRKALRRELGELACAATPRASESVVQRIAELAAGARAALERAQGQGAEDAHVHRFRVSVKRLRYALEPFERTDPAALALDDALAATQELLGSARDRTEIAARLESYADRLRSTHRTSLATAVSQLALGYRHEGDVRIERFRREGPAFAVRVALSFGGVEPAPATV